MKEGVQEWLQLRPARAHLAEWRKRKLLTAPSSPRRTIVTRIRQRHLLRVLLVTRCGAAAAGRARRPLPRSAAALANAMAAIRAPSLLAEHSWGRLARKSPMKNQTAAAAGFWGVAE